MSSYQHGNKINFLRICIETIHVILIISVVLGTFLGKMFLMNKCTFNAFQSSDLRLKGVRGDREGIKTRFSSRNPKGSYSFDVHSYLRVGEGL